MTHLRRRTFEVGRRRPYHDVRDGGQRFDELVVEQACADPLRCLGGCCPED
jgi:hypothetical protein